MATAKTAAKTSEVKSAGAAKEAGSRLKRAQLAANLLKHLSEPSRLRVVLMLSEGEKHVGALCALDQTQPAVSHHLALLRHGGVIMPRRQGKNNFYSLTEIGRRLAEVAGSLIA